MFSASTAAMLAVGLPPIAGIASDTGWVKAGAMSTVRINHTATLLTSGKVLVVGGDGPLGRLATAELYDPATNRWSTGGSMSVPRHYHTATLLGNGKVLVAGGSTGPGGILASAELYDPSKNRWQKAASMSTPRAWAAAALLQTGRVLMMGGIATGAGVGLATTELYDPVTDSWSTAATMNTGRQEGSTLTVLQGGKVLVVGEAQPQLYDPGTNGWSSAGTMAETRIKHVAVRLQDGRVMVAGGLAGKLILASTEFYDPATNAWEGGSLMSHPTRGMTATLLRDGTVAVAGGNECARIDCHGFRQQVDSFDPKSKMYTLGPGLLTPRTGHTATALRDGDLLVVGGSGASGVLDSAERLLAATSTYDQASASAMPEASATWQPAAVMHYARFGHTATLLKDGRVLVAGGIAALQDAPGAPPSEVWTNAETYDPSTNLWSLVGSMSVARYHHSATLLEDGRVLVIGGSNRTGAGPAGALASAEIFDPNGNTWTAGPDVPAALTQHTATLLKTGKVLVSGGDGVQGLLDDAFLFDPTTKTWSAAGNMATPRDSETATLLNDGKVLIAGGGASLASAEIYVPGTNAWVPAPSMATGRTRHTANLLPSGKVLVAGGQGTDGPLASAELYDAGANAWSPAGSMDAPREGQTSTTLPDGQVMGMCGGGPGPDAPSAEVYEPSTNTWTPASEGMGPSPEGHSATLLPNGSLLVAGGQVGSKAVAGASVVKVRPLSTAGKAKANWLSTYMQPIVGLIAILGLVLIGLGVVVTRRLRTSRRF